jgi:hypothetical protein
MTTYLCGVTINQINGSIHKLFSNYSRFSEILMIYYLLGLELIGKRLQLSPCKKLDRTFPEWSQKCSLLQNGEFMLLVYVYVASWRLQLG